MRPAPALMMMMMMVMVMVVMVMVMVVMVMMVVIVMMVVEDLKRHFQGWTHRIPLHHPQQKTDITLPRNRENHCPIFNVMRPPF